MNPIICLLFLLAGSNLVSTQLLLGSCVLDTDGQPKVAPDYCELICTTTNIENRCSQMIFPGYLQQNYSALAGITCDFYLLPSGSRYPCAATCRNFARFQRICLAYSAGILYSTPWVGKQMIWAGTKKKLLYFFLSVLISVSRIRIEGSPGNERLLFDPIGP